MPTTPQSVSDNIRYLQQQINRVATAPMGPVSLEPGDGHIRMNDGTNDTGFLDFEGVRLRYRGAMWNLTTLTESFANSIEAHSGRLDGHDAAVVRIDAKDAAQDDSLSKKAWTTYVDSQDSGLSGRINTNDANTRSREDALSGRITTAQSRADSAHSNAGSAQSRADAAYSLAASKANVSYVDTKASSTRVDGVDAKAQDAVNKVAALRDQTRDWMERARATNPSLPPPIPN